VTAHKLVRYTVTSACALAMVAVLIVGDMQGWPWVSMTIAELALGALLLMRMYEKMAADPKKIAFIATMTAVASVGRDAVQGIPGVQPATFMILMTGYTFGPAAGAAVGAFTAIASNILLGEGGWTPWQMLAWGLVGFTSGLLGKIAPRLSMPVLALFGFVWGYAFGWLMNTWLLVTAAQANLGAYIALDVRSFPDDSFHAIATGGLVLLAGRPVYKMLVHLRDKMVFSRG